MTEQLLIRASLIKTPRANSGYKAYELRAMKEIYPTYGATAVRKYLPWRSIDSIHKRAEKLKLKKISSKGIIRSCRKWSAKEQKIVNDHHGEEEKEIYKKLKSIGSDKTFEAVSTRISETRVKLNAKKEDRKRWPTDDRVLLAKNIKKNPADIVKIFEEKGLNYSKQAIKRARRRMLDNYVQSLNTAEGSTIMPLDHVVKTENVRGILLNGLPITVKNGGLIETKDGYEVAAVVMPGDVIKFT